MVLERLRDVHERDQVEQHQERHDVENVLEVAVVQVARDPEREDAVERACDDVPKRGRQQVERLADTAHRLGHFRVEQIVR